MNNDKQISKTFADHIATWITSFSDTRITGGHGSRCIVSGTQNAFDHVAMVLDKEIAIAKGAEKRSLKAARSRIRTSEFIAKEEAAYQARRAARKAAKAAKAARQA